MSAAAAARVLVAGIGNVFFGDDAFGVEVVGRIDAATLPENVRVAEYGIRGVHLAYDLLDGRYDTVILVDAMPLGEPPGTLAIVDASEAASAHGGREPPACGVDAHSMNPAAVLQSLRAIGGHVDRALVVGCQPAVVDRGMELSPSVRAAVDEAVHVVRELAANEASRTAYRIATAVRQTGTG
jgi:hydrogenase maturation protease